MTGRISQNFLLIWIAILSVSLLLSLNISPASGWALSPDVLINRISDLTQQEVKRAKTGMIRGLSTQSDPVVDFSEKQPEPELYKIRIKLNNPTYATYAHAPNPYNKSLVSIFQIDDSPKTVYNLMYPYLKGGTTAGGYASPGVMSTDGCGNQLHWTVSVACFVENDRGEDLLSPGASFISWPELAEITANGPGLQRGFDYDNHGFGGLPTLQKDRYQQIFLNNQAAFQNLGFHPEALVVPDVQIGFRFGANDMGMDVTSQAGVEPLRDGKIPFAENASTAAIYAAIQNPIFVKRNHWQEINSAALVGEHKAYILDAYTKSLTSPGIYHWFSHGPGEIATSNFQYYREVIDYMRSLAGDNVIGMSLSQYLGYQKTRYAAENGALKSSVLTPEGYLDITFDMTELPKTVRNRLLTLLVTSDSQIQSVTWSSNIKAVTFNPSTGLVNVQLQEAAGVNPASLPLRPVINASSVQVEESSPNTIKFSVNRAINQSDLAAYEVEGNEVTAISPIAGSGGLAWKLICKNNFLSTDVVTLTYRAELGNALDQANGTKMLSYWRLPAVNHSKETGEQTTPLAISVIRDSDNIQLATFNTIAETRSYLSTTNFNSNLSVVFNEARSYPIIEKWMLNYNNGAHSLTLRAKEGLSGRPEIDAGGSTSDVFRIAMNHVRISGLKIRSGKYISDGAAFGDNYSGALISQTANTSDVRYTDLILYQGMRGIRIGAANGTDQPNISDVLIDQVELRELTGIAIQVGIHNNSPADPEIRPNSSYTLNDVTIRNIKLRDTRNKAEIETSGSSFYGQIQCRGIRNLTIENVDAFQNQKQPFYIVASKNVLIDKCRATEFSLNTGSGYKAAFHIESTDGITIQNSLAQAPYENVYIHGSRGIRLLHNTFDNDQSDSRTVSLHNVSTILDIRGNLIIAKGNAPWYSCIGGSFYRGGGYIPTMDNDFVSEKYNLFVGSAFILDFSGLGVENKQLTVKTTFEPDFDTYKTTFNRGQGSNFSARETISFTELSGVSGYLSTNSAGRNFIPSMVDTLLKDLANNTRTYPADAGAFDRENEVAAPVADAGKSVISPLISAINADGSSSQILTVTVKDSKGNTMELGGANVKITKVTGGGTVSSITDNGNGTYTAIVTADSEPGDALFTATVDGQPITAAGIQVTAKVTFKASNNAELSALTVGPGTLSPAFNRTVKEYTLFVDQNVTQITVSPVLVHSRASVKVNENSPDTGATSATISIQHGDVILINSLAADGITADQYKVSVKYAAPVFPSRESFMTAAAANLILGGSPKSASLTSGSTDVVNGGYLRLTDNQANQSGFARSTLHFPATNGLNVNFEYYSHNGSGGDGLTFFLYDPSAAPFTIGALGGSLGYAQTTNSGGASGLSKAFIGIGFDEYGNFSNSNAGRQGGVGFRPSSVTLRGDGNGSAAVPDNYEFLTNIQTTDAQAMSQMGAGGPFLISGMVDGRSKISSTRLYGGLTPLDPGYRKARIEMLPKSSGAGYIVNIWITEGSLNGGIVHHVIKDYAYTGDTNPSTLSYGFVSSTGGSNNFHEIRNLEVLVPSHTAMAPNVPLASQKEMNENSTLKFKSSDFYSAESPESLFQDPNGDALLKIKLTALPQSGLLSLLGSAVQVGQEIVLSDIGSLEYTPQAGFTGEVFFRWTGADPGGLYPSADGEFRIKVRSSTITITASIAENEIFTGSNGQNAKKYKLSGTDAFRFSLNESTGSLKLFPQNYENPVDSDTNNVYEAQVVALDESENQFIYKWKVTVTNINESADFQLAAFEDVVIEEGTSFASSAPIVTGKTIGGAAPENFTLVPIPDTQFYTSEMNGGTNSIFKQQTKWVVDNRGILNIKYLSHLGDCVQNGDNNGNDAEWKRADEAMRTLEDPALTGLPFGIPFGVNVGNHDQSPFDDPNGSTIFFNQFFGASRFQGRPYYGGHYGLDNDNNYQLFTAGGMDFIVINLEFDPSANPAILNWADALLKANSDRRAIVTSHWILNAGGSFSAQGQAIYDNLKDNPNLFLMLTGHIAGEARRTDVFNGSTVHTLLSDYQNRPNGGNGWLRYIEFLTAENKLRVRTFSPSLQSFEIDEDSEFVLDYPMSNTVLPGSLLYTLAGKDASNFTVDSRTGVVMMSPREYSRPLDENRDNIYELSVLATDRDGNMASQSRKVKVIPARASPHKSILSITRTELPADGASTGLIKLTSIDKEGELFEKGGSTVSFTMLSGDMEIGPVQDHADGTYSAVYTASTTPGLNAFVATLDGQPVKNGTNELFQVTVDLIASTDASLDSIEISGHLLAPDFSPEVLNYSVYVASGVSSVQIKVHPGNLQASVKIGNIQISDPAFLNLDLVVGLNSVPIEVKAQNGIDAKTYIIKITREAPLFPYSETFTQPAANKMLFGGSPQAAMLTGGVMDLPGKGYLRLTSNAANQMGFARSTTLFPTKDGLSVNFEYYTYGGNGGDGLSFYLYDPSIEVFEPGAFGGSLGYAQSTNGGGTAGVSKGFIGIGIDEFGNFSNPVAGRQGGVGERSSSLTFRGDGNGKLTIPSNYEYLSSVQTTNPAAMSAAGGGSTFNIAGKVNPRSGSDNTTGLSGSDNGYRKIRVDLIPNGASGFLIDAWITEGNPSGAITHKLISSFPYIPHGGVPEFLSYGFAASTGGMNNIHEVRNLEIRVPQLAPQPAIVHDVSKSVEHNTTLQFAALDFSGAFVSPSGKTMNRIKVLNLPADGTLKLGSNLVTPNQEIAANQISTLSFEPVAGFVGQTSFRWTGADDIQYASGSGNVTLRVLPLSNSALPYFESFSNSAVPGLVMGGTQPASLTAASGVDSDGTGYLRLTSNAANQLGFARSQTAFNLSEGLLIDFEYYSYGGSGGDGMSFFLYDAAANSNFRIGAPGGSLGYAQNWSDPGVSKGYIGFGFDEFGNFSTGTAGRQGGPGGRPSSLTIRGDGDGPGAGSPGGSNYEFIAQVQTTDVTIMSGMGGAFNVSGNVNGRSAGVTGLNLAQPGYRKAKISLAPNSTGNGFLVNVWIVEGSVTGAINHHLIKNLNYIGNTLPEFVSYGFAGSTGGVNNFHEVRNLNVRKFNPIEVDPLMTTREDANGGSSKGTIALYEGHTPLGDAMNAGLDPTDMITPNNDGRNDTWVIRNISLYPGYRVRIFSKLGIEVYNKVNYANDWDAKQDGRDLPSDVYYYFIENPQRKVVLKGYVNVKR